VVEAAPGRGEEMASTKMDILVRFIQSLAATQTDDDTADRQLLGRYLGHHDEAAFAKLVSRHGPMVFKVCQRVLHNSHDAEDAFQATFLVLARKAGSVQHSLVGWLSCVAYRAALDLKRRRLKEEELVAMRQDPEAPTADPPGSTRLQQLLQEEVGRLPEEYRVPVILCYLEGKTNQKAADQLGWPVGTVKTRLAKARNMLRKRLRARNLALPSAVLIALLAENASPAAVPAQLISTAAKAAVLYAAGKDWPPGGMSARVAALAERLLRTVASRGVLMWVAVVGLTLFTVGAWFSSGGETETATPSPPSGNTPAIPRLVRVALEDVGAVAAGDNSFCCQYSHGGNLLAVGRSHANGIAWIDVLTTANWNKKRLYFSAFDGKNVRDLSAVVDVPRLLSPRETGVRSLTFTANDRLLLAGMRNGRIYAWPVAEQDPKPVFWEAHRGEVSALGLSPDGRTLASAASDGTLRLWALESGTLVEIASHQFDSALDDVQFDPQGNLVVCGCRKWLRVFDVKSLRSAGTLPEMYAELQGDHRKVAFVGAKMSHVIASQGRDLALLRIDQTKLTVLRTFGDATTGTAHEDEINGLAVTPDGLLLVSGSGDKWTKLWELGSGRLLDARYLGGEGNIHPTVSPDGQNIAVTGDCKCVLYNVARVYEVVK
jgi:RNA polymerase sigma factor (sigma-70 family)